MAGESVFGQSGWALTGLAPGALVAGYRVEARIGAGGMAMVLRARDEALGRTVALKILAPARAGDTEFRERFVRESRAVAAVDHPHIIPVYAAGEASGVLYLAMRFVAGGDLRSVVAREGPLPEQPALEPFTSKLREEVLALGSLAGAAARKPAPKKAKKPAKRRPLER